MYEIRLNIPNEKEIKIIEVDDETMQKMIPFINKRSVIDIDGYIFNSAYFIDATKIRTMEEKMLLLTNYKKNETTMAQKDNL